MVLLNPSGRGVSDEIASALRRDDELIDLKVSGLRQQVIAGCDVACLYMLESQHWPLAPREVQQQG